MFIIDTAVIVLLCAAYIEGLQIFDAHKDYFNSHHNQYQHQHPQQNSQSQLLQNRRSFLSTSATVTTATTTGTTPFLIMSSSLPSPAAAPAPAETEGEQKSHPLNVALIGAGIFASTCHAPILKDNPDIFNCVAVWSRHIDSASTLVSKTLQQSKAYSDLDEVLALPNLDAVIMALPLDVQPEYVMKCLKANKHVLSEKPIAPTVDEAAKLLEMYEKEYTHLTWSVAENFRYEPAIIRASEIIQGDNQTTTTTTTTTTTKKIIGDPFLVSLTIRAPFASDNKYLNTPWRKEPSWYGGLFCDAFVHASAMLRSIVGDAQSVTAVTSSNADFIPGIDTMSANIVWPNNVLGSLSVTYFCKDVKFELEIIGSGGKMTLTRKTDGPGYRVVTVSNDDGERVEEDFGYGGLKGEFFAFAAACKGEGVDRNTPSEAFLDIAFVEACLLSGKDEGLKKDVAKL